MSKLPPNAQKIFDDLTDVRPITPLLDSIDNPSDLKRLTGDELCQLSDEVRAFLLYSVGQSGGHFGANLGVVELTVALHFVFNAPKDQIVWDVGHQAYVHKILTGRRERLPSIRSQGGLTAFPERTESVYDTFGVGHSSTAISAALGMSLALRHQHKSDKVVAIVGDGAMTGGMAFEAMNDTVQQNADLIVILNDNDMSISQATGGFSKHLATLWRRGLAVDIDKNGNAIITKRNIDSEDRRIRHYLHMANEVFDDLSVRLPKKISQKLAQKGLPSVAQLESLPEKLANKVIDEVFPENLFKAIGFSYFGPFDGHDVVKLTQVFERIKSMKGAVLVHVHTVKGKGFVKAESDPIGYHAISRRQKTAVLTNTPPKTYSQIFGQFLLDTAKVDNKLMAITPAMAEGSGMVAFAKHFPNQYFDVAIAEQHAVTLAGGMATQQLKPIVAIYSTFLQRGYDQLIHDIALQNLDVMFAIDRAGLVGEDGATHAGVFDIAFMRCVPNVVIAVPSNENECYHLLKACYHHQGVTAVRYPRGAGVGVAIDLSYPAIAIGQARLEQAFNQDTTQDTTMQNTKQIALLAFGSMVNVAVLACKILAKNLPKMTFFVYNMRFVKPLDETLIAQLIDQNATIITLEEHQKQGGAGSFVNEVVIEYCANTHQPLPRLLNIGIDDHFVVHASHSQQLSLCKLDVEGVVEQIEQFLS